MTRYVVRLGSVRGEGAYVADVTWLIAMTVAPQRRARRFVIRRFAAMIAAEVGGRVVRLRRRA